jgi:signal peptidase I
VTANKWLREAAELVFFVLIVIVAIHFSVQSFRVKGVSMLPTVQNKQLVLVDKLDYDFSSPHVGDVVIFNAPPAPGHDYIKRIMGVPGDRVQIRKNIGVYINGTLQHEPYIKAIPDYDWPPSGGSRVVPPGDYFVLGDNRNDSFDSHEWPKRVGPWVPRHDIIGKVIIAYWPLNEFRFFSF